MRHKSVATQFQLDFVADIEAAVTAMTKDRKPTGVKITEVMEMAGKEIHDLRPTIMRLWSRKEIELLRRMDAAFQQVGISQTTLKKKLRKFDEQAALGVPASEVEDDEDEPGMDEVEELKLEPSIPGVPVPPHQAVKNLPAAANSGDEDIEVMAKVLRILNPRSKSSQKRVINSVAVFLGVGE